jgi:hypothetical protein
MGHRKDVRIHHLKQVVTAVGSDFVGMKVDVAATGKRGDGNRFGDGKLPGDPEDVVQGVVLMRTAELGRLFEAKAGGCDLNHVNFD